MSKFLVSVLVIALVAITITASIDAQAQVQRNVVLEFCTGTWCQWCPCGDQTAEALLQTYPNLIVLAYHGAGTDPWQNFNGSSIRGLLGFSAYPTATVDRRNHPGGGGFPYFDYTTWTGVVSQRYNTAPTTNVAVDVLSKSYSSSTRQFDLTVSATALQNLVGQYKMSLIITEDSSVYPQTGNSTCGFPPNPYYHRWTVRSMVNGPAGENLNTGLWAQNQSLSRSFSTTIDLSWNAATTKFTILVYKDSTSGLYLSEIAQAIKGTLLGTTEVSPPANGIPMEFSLSQNFPNPFNPTTTFDFAVSRQSFVSLKVYNLLGQEVRTLVSEEKGVGVYQAKWDGQDNVGAEVPSGMYMYKMIAGDFSQTKKMMLLR